MATLRIEGGRRLSGQLTVEGNKNSALPLMAACLLTDEECILANVPRIRDVAGMADLLTSLGATVDGVGTSTLRIFPARRTIGTHLQALVALGAVLFEEPGHVLEAPSGFTGASFYLEEASVTGTETAILAAVAAKGRTEIRHAAMEPHGST